TALAYIPKERYDSAIRLAAGEAIAKAYGGQVDSFTQQLGEGQLARVLYVISDIDRQSQGPDQRTLDSLITNLARNWKDNFSDALMGSDMFDAVRREDASNRFDEAFTAAYRERYSIDEALIDTAEIQSAQDSEVVRVRAYRLPTDTDNVMRCKFY